MAEAGGARALLECRRVGCEGTARQLIALKSSVNVYELYIKGIKGLLGDYSKNI